MQVLSTIDLQTNRSKTSVLLVSDDSTLSGNLRQVLANLGFPSISSAANHILALDRLLQRKFDIILFQAKSSNMPSDQFVKQARKISPEAIFVSVTNDPRIDDIFSMLRHGARGFLCLPMSVEQVEQVLQDAATSAPLSQAILEARDRDKALAIMVLNNLYRLSETMRYSRQYPNGISDVGRLQSSFSESVNLARLFCKGGEEILREKICEECCLRAERPSTRLGKTRLKLKNMRKATENVLA